MATDLLATGPAGIGSPVFDPSGELFVVCMPEGSIMKVDASKGGLEEVDTTGGQPAALAIDTRGAAHVADLAMGAVMHRMSLPGSDGAGDGTEGGAAASGADSSAWVTSVVEYEGEPLRGPSSVAIDSSGTLFFTDSGPLGDTTLEQPRGSLFCVTGSGRGRYLKPLILKSLAHPCAVAIGTTDNVVFVAELLRNRVLRLVQKPAGVYHTSVFHQFSGRMGPSAIVVDRARSGLLYVALFDVAEAGQEEGEVAVLSPSGERLRSIKLPGPEVSGLALSPDGSFLVATEASTGGIHRVGL